MNDDSIIKVNHSRLAEFSQEMLKAAGLEENGAEIAASSLIEANLMGIDTHGVMRLPIYCRRLKENMVNPNPEIEFEKRSPATGMIDGKNGQGQIVGHKATEKVIGLAREEGAGFVGVKMSNHFGIAGFFSRRIIKEDQIGIVFSNAPSCLVPFGGGEPYFGTNPISVGFPTGKNFDIIIDMATSRVAMGKIIMAEKNNQQIPEDWAIDQNGTPTTDPREAKKGGLLPAGGPKGSALALMVSIFTGVLTGAKWGEHLRSMFKNFEEPQNFGHFFGAFDIESFISSAEYYERINSLVDEIKSIPPAAGFEEVKLPGEIEAEEKKKRIEQGIPLKKEIAGELKKLNKRLKAGMELFPDENEL
ncbi:Ldh family oxidoreductase [Halarsenatibacter silvermanii]|uniref:Malate/lactate/ureidoglycolate dehydrogenase, LDH2 family n=1 Tax=Halarsenatibacter silvermanii TaxID=321763 RepID=A0A1G9SUK0_9FIRM|nr:Ldh family oxidoreductase [Halarsenatibacter silvermanii]SDM38525.1 Malate/lactate/ureidoglycolate dehydrogenase, LDH2 family [Halarsenatibacter silvermanii]